MWTTTVNRTEFLGILGAKSGGGFAIKECADPGSMLPPKGNNVCLIWDSNPKLKWDLPTTVITSDVDTKDFLAWASTYLQGFSPFSAFFRVYDWSSFRDCLEITERPALGSIANASASLIMAEALVQSSVARDLESQSMSVFKSTFSFSMARAIANGSLTEKVEPLFRRWNALAELVNQPRRRLQTPVLERVWMVLNAINFSENKRYNLSPEITPVAQACSELVQSGEISNTVWSVLTEGDRFLLEFREEMRKNREHRVLIFKEMFVRLYEKPNYPAEREFLLGYAASLISPGSLSHMDFLLKTIQPFTSILFWYAVCAGLHPDSEVLKSFKCLGRRIIRDVLIPESPFSIPRHDISFEELEMLATADNPEMSFRRASVNFLFVEILPCVTVQVNWQKRNSAQAQQEFFQNEESAKKAGDILELERSLRKALEMLSRISPSGKRRIENL